jgi:hypothetical protein
MSEIKRYAHIEDETVTNVSLWDGVTPWEPGCEVVELPDDSPVGPGWTREDGEWVAPPPSPEQLAMLEALNEN